MGLQRDRQAGREDAGMRARREVSRLIRGVAGWRAAASGESVRGGAGEADAVRRSWRTG